MKTSLLKKTQSLVHLYDSSKIKRTLMKYNLALTFLKKCLEFSFFCITYALNDI